MLGRHNRRTEESLARLRDRLHAEAERHQPDTERIWARVQAAMAEPGHLPQDQGDTGDLPSRRRGRRPVLVLLSAASVVGVTSLSVLLLAGTGDDSSVTLDRHGVGFRSGTAGPAAPSASGTPSSSDMPHTAGQAGGTASAVPRPSRRPAHTPGQRQAGTPLVTAIGSLGQGSNEHWARNAVTLTVHRPLSSLDVTIRIARHRWTFPLGSWTSLPKPDVWVDIDVDHDVIVYRFTLRPGRTVAPGTYVLAADYRPSGRHDPGEDAFTVTATGTRGGPTTRIGEHF